MPAFDPFPLYFVVCDQLTLFKVNIVDSFSNGVGNNFVFRTDLPVDSNLTRFLYDDLKAFMAQRAAEANLTFPSSYFLIDASLLTADIYADDKKALDIEDAFFAKNPSLGKLVRWPSYGI